MMFWWFMGENFEFSRCDPARKSVPAETRRLVQKRRRYSQKCVLQSLARNQKPKNVKKTFEHDISPLCRGDPTWPIFTIFGMWNQSFQISSRLRQALGSHGGPKSGVSHWLSSSLLQQCYSLPCYTVTKTDDLESISQISQSIIYLNQAKAHKNRLDRHCYLFSTKTLPYIVIILLLVHVV